MDKKSFLKTISLREIILFGLCLFVSYFAFVKKWDNIELEKDKIVAQEKVKQLEKEKVAQHLITDSLKSKVLVTEGIIEFQKQNPQIIIEKYDKIRDNLNLLSADESISYLSDRLSEEGGN